MASPIGRVPTVRTRTLSGDPAPVGDGPPPRDGSTGPAPDGDQSTVKRPAPAPASGWRGWVRTLRPSTPHSVQDLPAAQQTAYAAILVGLALLPILSAVIVLMQGWRPAGDNALIGLRVHDVLTAHFPLIGQPTTGENFGSGIATSHPGPIEFYLVAPFVAVLGPIVGLAVGAAAINAVAMAGVAWAAFRRGGLGLMTLAALGTVAMARSLGGNLLHDPVSSNVGAVMALLLLFLAWSVLAGDLRAIPAFVFAGTFALQDHLTYLGTGTPVVLMAIVAGLWWSRQVWKRSRSNEWLKRRLRVGGIMGVVLWFPVLFDEAFGDHNLTAIFRTFTGKRTASEGVGFAAKRLAEAMAPWPMFSRRFGPLGYLHTPDTRELVSGYLVLAAVAGLGAYFAWRKRTDLAAMAAIALVAAIAGAYSSVKLPVGAGIQASNLRWMWTASAFVWVTLAWLVWQALKPAWRHFLDVPAVALCGLALALAASGVVGSVDLQTDRDGRIAPDTTALIERVKQMLPKGRYRVTFAGGSVVVTVGPALVHALDYRGDILRIDGGPVSRAYAEHRMYEKGDKVDGTLLVSAEADASYPEGTKLLARQSFEVNRQDAAVNVIRVYLLEGAT